ncbi:MAG: hypothetical protein ACREVO_14425 [Steroidobacteraceae bacterium]
MASQMHGSGRAASAQRGRYSRFGNETHAAVADRISDIADHSLADVPVDVNLCQRAYEHDDATTRLPQT